MLDDVLTQSYESSIVAFERAMTKVINDLTALSTDYAPDYKIKYKKGIDRRIKTLDSVREKITRKHVADIFELKDLVGVKVIVHNLSDAKKLATLILDKWCDKEMVVEDYIVEPKKSGYRGIHINFTQLVDVKGNQIFVPIEIQIKTLAEDLWSILSHDDLYKASIDIPEIINQFSTSLGALLDVVDNQAQFIRDFISRKVVISKDLTFDPSDEVDREIIAKIIFDDSGYEISQQDYLMIAKCLQKNNITTADTLRKLISTDKIRSEVYRIFRLYDLQKPSTLDVIVYGASVYYDFMATKEIDSYMLEDQIKDDFDISESVCEICNTRLTNQEVDNCDVFIEDLDIVCPVCLSNFSECPKCNILTMNEGLCYKCSSLLDNL